LTLTNGKKRKEGGTDGKEECQISAKIAEARSPQKTWRRARWKRPRGTAFTNKKRRVRASKGGNPLSKKSGVTPSAGRGEERRRVDKGIENGEEDGHGREAGNTRSVPNKGKGKNPREGGGGPAGTQQKDELTRGGLEKGRHKLSGRDKQKWIPTIHENLQEEEKGMAVVLRKRPENVGKERIDRDENLD